MEGGEEKGWGGWKEGKKDRRKRRIGGEDGGRRWIERGERKGGEKPGHKKIGSGKSG